MDQFRLGLLKKATRPTSQDIPRACSLFEVTAFKVKDLSLELLKLHRQRITLLGKPVELAG
jgi:hypothetical protein